MTAYDKIRLIDRLQRPFAENLPQQCLLFTTNTSRSFDTQTEFSGCSTPQGTVRYFKPARICYTHLMIFLQVSSLVVIL